MIIQVQFKFIRSKESEIFLTLLPLCNLNYNMKGCGVNEVERKKINHKLQIQLVDKKKEHETYRNNF